MAVGYKAVFVSFDGIIPYMGYANNRIPLNIIYLREAFEKTGFPNDLFCQTKAFRAL
jgi:hypothetical protein